MTNQIKPTRKGLRLEIEREELALMLKTYRLRQDLNQEQLGKLWGCSRWTIMRLEHAKPCTWEMMYRVYNKLSMALAKEQPEI